MGKVMTQEEFASAQKSLMTPEQFQQFQGNSLPSWKQAIAKYGPAVAKATGATLGSLAAAPANIVAPGVAEAAGGTLGYLGGAKAETALERLLGIQGAQPSALDQIKALPETLPREAADTARMTPEAASAVAGGMAGGTALGRVSDVAKIAGKSFLAKHLGLKLEESMPTFEELGRILGGTDKGMTPSAKEFGELPKSDLPRGSAPEATPATPTKTFGESAPVPTRTSGGLPPQEGVVPTPQNPFSQIREYTGPVPSDLRPQGRVFNTPQEAQDILQTSPETIPPTTASELEKIFQARNAQVPGINAATTPAEAASSVSAADLRGIAEHARRQGLDQLLNDPTISDRLRQVLMERYIK